MVGDLVERGGEGTWTAGAPAARGLTPLMAAAAVNAARAVEALLERKADPDLLHKEEGNSALLLTAINRSPDTAKILTRVQTDLDGAIGQQGWTPRNRKC